MPYKVHKLIVDKRNNTCGFFIPNGGFYHVIEMTFENYQQLKNISQRPGYSVDYVEGKTGFFDGDGYEVDLASVRVNKITKIVEGYEKLTRKYRGKETAKKETHESEERESVEKLAQIMGIPTSLSTQEIKTQVDRAGKTPQNTLRVS